MSFSLYKLITPTHDADKYDRLSSLLLTPNQSVTGKQGCSSSEDDCDISLDVTFDNDGAVANIKIMPE